MGMDVFYLRERTRVLETYSFHKRQKARRGRRRETWRGEELGARVKPRNLL